MEELSSPAGPSSERNKSASGAVPRIASGCTRSGGDEPSDDRIKFLTQEIERMREEIAKLKEENGAADAERITMSQPNVNSSRNKRKTVRYSPLDMSQVVPERFNRYFSITFNGDEKRKVNPFRAFKEIENVSGSKPGAMTSMGRNSLLVTVSSKQQGEALLRMKKIDGRVCVVEAHRTLNTSKGLVFISEFDISAQELQDGLADQNVIEVSNAFWIKVQRPGVQVFLLTFSGDTPPEFLKIPGESMRTRVSEYHERPMQCKNCQEYGHTAKRCSQADNYRCGRCGRTGHGTSSCSEEAPSCYHCSGNHVAWNRKCSEHVFQAEVIKTQKKEKLSRREAIRVVRDRYPDRRTSFANAPRATASAVGGNQRVVNPVTTSNTSSTNRNTTSRAPDTAARKRPRSNRSTNAEGSEMQTEDSESDQSLEETLRQIYDQYSPKGKASRSPKKKQAKRAEQSGKDDRGSAEENSVYVGMIKLSKRAAEDESQTIRDLEKYKVARQYFSPPDDEQGEVEAFIVGVEKFPSTICLTGNEKSKVIPLEQFSERQKQHLCQLVTLSNA